MIPSLTILIAAYTIARLIQTAITIDADKRVSSTATAVSWFASLLAIVLILMMVYQVNSLGLRPSELRF